MGLIFQIRGTTSIDVELSRMRKRGALVVQTL